MILVLLLAITATLFAGWRAWRRLRYFLHLFQLEGYKPNEYVAWLRAHAGRVLWRRSHMVGLALLALAALGYAAGWLLTTTVLLLLGWCVAFASSKLYRSTQEKKPLAYTNRMKRLLATSAVLALLPVAIGFIIGAQGAEGPSGFLAYLGGFWVADLGAPLWVRLAALLMQPVEGRIQEGFKRQARQRLAERPDLTVIGITGSYGKTSVKFIVAEILKQQYNVLATPGSYNTPMGICLVVNTKLRDEHQMLVLEYGIRYPGDMEELCAIAQPDLSVVTTVGMAHLETMGSIENIAHEKSNLVAFTKPDGLSILNADNEYVDAMSARAPGYVLRVSVQGREDADLVARDIRYGPEGATFVVQDDEGHEATFQTQLLGEHNVLNILLGIAVGRAMGLRLRQMVHAVRRVEPVEHRLQLRKEGPITIIDDAFNSNPVGARNAVEILGAFDEGRRVIVTPGMIELGERQYEENKTLGTHIARHADLAVLVGPKQTRPIQDGLREAGYPEEQTKVFNSLFDAQAFLKSWLRPGDVVLYENDLPDQYDEAA